MELRAHVTRRDTEEESRDHLDGQAERLLRAAPSARGIHNEYTPQLLAEHLVTVDAVALRPPGEAQVLAVAQLRVLTARV